MVNFSKALVIKNESTRQKLRCILILFYLFAVVICGVSCVSTRKDPLEYRLLPFAAEVSFHGRDNEFDAVFTFSTNADRQDRSFSVRFLSPESLAGLQVSYGSDGMKIFLGNTEYLSLQSSFLTKLRLYSAAEMLSPTAPIRSILSIRGAECGLPSFTSLTAVTAGDNVIYIDPESSLPVKIDNLKSGEYLIIKSIAILNQ